jgi:hypothetical protein
MVLRSIQSCQDETVKPLRQFTERFFKAKSCGSDSTTLYGALDGKTSPPVSRGH